MIAKVNVGQTANDCYTRQANIYTLKSQYSPWRWPAHRKSGRGPRKSGRGGKHLRPPRRIGRSEDAAEDQAREQEAKGSARSAAEGRLKGVVMSREKAVAGRARCRPKGAGPGNAPSGE